MCSRGSESWSRAPRAAPRPGSSEGQQELAEIVRAFDRRAIKVANLELHDASLNDVFLAKTGRSLEGAGATEETEPGTGEHGIALEGSPA